MVSSIKLDEDDGLLLELLDELELIELDVELVVVLLLVVLSDELLLIVDEILVLEPLLLDVELLEVELPPQEAKTNVARTKVNKRLNFILTRFYFCVKIVRFLTIEENLTF